MTNNDYSITRSLNVTPFGYELTVSISRSGIKGNMRVEDMIMIKTFRPHSNLNFKKVTKGVIKNVA
jgi:hypothetical protein